VLVAGGDGTLATAAAVLAGIGVELAVLPGGTLNHFARDHGIPTELPDAVQVALTGVPRAVDVAEVNGELFLNTSAVGAYVVFVRTREYLELRMGYRLASLLAALRVLATMRSFRVALEVEGQTRVYRTPLVFVGVGERELRVPALGGRVEGGRRALHVLVVRSRSSTRAITLSLALAARGVRAVTRTAALDGFLVDACSIEMRRPFGYVALDGETRRLQAPLEYRLRREVLTSVVPREPA
jgi:diacylglycerol kinase family enzyme